MIEKTLSITSVRQNLLKLAKTAQRRMDRYILTNKGQAEAVLLGIGDYKSLKAAGQLMLHPEVLEQTREGFARLREGAGLTLEEAFERLRKNRKRAAPTPHSVRRRGGVY